MSHSRIIVLDENMPNPEWVFDEMSSYGNGVDYVQPSPSSFESDYEWAMDYLSDLGFTPTEDRNGFKLNSELDFWESMHDEVISLLEEGINNKHWQIEDAVSMKDSFWVWWDSNLYTLPNFVEQIEEGKEFKIYGFLDYHF